MFDPFGYRDMSVQLARIERKLDYLLRASQKEEERDIMAQADIQKLRDQVARNRDAVSSAVTLIRGLAQQVKDLADDPAELQALATELEANATSLGQAVTENTPAAPQPPA